MRRAAGRRSRSRGRSRRRDDELHTPPYVVNIGPQHPSTHGVFRLRVTLDGERIIDAEMVLGYLHRSMEKLAEERTYTQNIPFTDRMDYLAAMTGNLGYCLAVEKLAGIEVPERGSYLRVIFAELQRIASHCMANGTFVNDCGAWQTPLMYMFREREKILDLFEMTCGARLTTNYMRIGGVAFDVPDEWYPAIDVAGGRDAGPHLRVRRAAARQRDPPGPRPRRRRADAGRGDQRLGQRAAAARLRHRLGHPQGRPLLRLRPLRLRHPGRPRRRLLRPLHRAPGGDAPERAHHRAGAGAAARRAGQHAGAAGAEAASPARPTRASSRRRASWASTWSATAARRRTAGTCARLRSSTSPCCKDMVVGQPLADAIVTLGSIDINVGEIDR